MYLYFISIHVFIYFINLFIYSFIYFFLIKINAAITAKRYKNIMYVFMCLYCVFVELLCIYVYFNV